MVQVISTIWWDIRDLLHSRARGGGRYVHRQTRRHHLRRRHRFCAHAHVLERSMWAVHFLPAQRRSSSTTATGQSQIGKPALVGEEGQRRRHSRLQRRLSIERAAGCAPDGGAFTVFIAGLNNATFAGHRDWRLPTSANSGQAPEVESTVDTNVPDCGSGAPCVPPAFDTNCGPYVGDSPPYTGSNPGCMVDGAMSTSNAAARRRIMPGRLPAIRIRPRGSSATTSAR